MRAPRAGASRLVELLREAVAEVSERPLLWLWALYPLAAPFYTNPSGKPQISDGLLTLAVAAAGLSRHLRRTLLAPPSQYLLAFLAWTVLVNTAWALIGTGVDGRHPVTDASLFMTFNVAVFIAFLTAYVRHRHVVLVVFTASTALSLAIQFVLASVVGQTSDVLRLELFFNNPNQLGYFVVLSATVVVLGALALRLPVVFIGAALGAAFVVALLSLSRSAVVGVAVLALATIARRLSSVLVVLALTIGGLLWVNQGSVEIDRLTATTELQMTDPQGRSFLWKRGYDRISTYPQYLVLGAGDGDYERFDPLFPRELHSTWGNIVFSYGVPGVLLFGAFAIRLVSGSGAHLLLLLPTFVYGLAHQGLRFRYFWLLLAFYYCVLGDRTLGLSKGKRRALAPWELSARLRRRWRARPQGPSRRSRRPAPPPS